MSNGMEQQEVSVDLMDGNEKRPGESAGGTSTRCCSCKHRLCNNDVVKIGIPIALFIFLLWAGWGLYTYFTGMYKNMCSRPGFCR